MSRPNAPWAIAGLSLALAACAEPTEWPEPPDLAPLVQAYQQPTGRVTAESARQLLAESGTALGLVQDPAAILELVQGFFDGLAQAGEASEDSEQSGLRARRAALTVAGAQVDGEAWMRYRRDCPRASGAGARGVLELNALADVDGFQPVVWGAARDCRILAEGDAAGSLIDGGIALHVEWIDGGVGQILIRIDGALNLAGTAFDGLFSIAWSAADASLATLVERPDGESFLLGTVGGQLAISGVNGRYLCDDMGCAGPDGRFAW